MKNDRLVYRISAYLLCVLIILSTLSFSACNLIKAPDIKPPDGAHVDFELTFNKYQSPEEAVAALFDALKAADSIAALRTYAVDWRMDFDYETAIAADELGETFINMYMPSEYSEYRPLNYSRFLGEAAEDVEYITRTLLNFYYRQTHKDEMGRCSVADEAALEDYYRYIDPQNLAGITYEMAPADSADDNAAAAAAYKADRIEAYTVKAYMLEGVQVDIDMRLISREGKWAILDSNILFSEDTELPSGDWGVDSAAERQAEPEFVAVCASDESAVKRIFEAVAEMDYDKLFEAFPENFGVDYAEYVIKTSRGSVLGTSERGECPPYGFYLELRPMIYRGNTAKSLIDFLHQLGLGNEYFIQSEEGRGSGKIDKESCRWYADYAGYSQSMAPDKLSKVKFVSIKPVSFDEEKRQADYNAMIASKANSYEVDNLTAYEVRFKQGKTTYVMGISVMSKGKMHAVFMLDADFSRFTIGFKRKAMFMDVKVLNK